MITNQNSLNKTILGIDTGTLNFGYCVLRKESAKYTVYTNGILDLHDLEDQIEKNKRIYGFLSSLFETYDIDEMAIEIPVYGKDPQSMLKLGRVLGCCIGFAIAHNCQIWEYPPKNVKKVITGNGNAAKQQVAYMVSKILNIPFVEKSKYDDMDATAIALCHAYNLSGVPMMSSKKSWDRFIKDNPERIL